MSGSYPDTAASTIAADEAGVVAGVAQALTWTSLGQAEVARFIADNGAAVTAGHDSVGVLPPSIAGNE